MLDLLLQFLLEMLLECLLDPAFWIELLGAVFEAQDPAARRPR